MKFISEYRSKSVLGFPVMIIKRHLITFRKFRELYREFWYPSPSRPPYDHICQVGDPVLRYNAEELNPDDIKKSEIRKVLKKMHDVMSRYGSVGLAAPQIGVPLRIFMIEFSEKMSEKYSPDIQKSREMAIIPLKVFINPKVTVVNYEKVLYPEVCESVRGFSADVMRYREVLVSGFLVPGLDAEGKPISWQTSGWPARIVQHEMDHLCGRLYTDIMVRSTFTCTCWEKVNRTGGRIYVPFAPK